MHLEINLATDRTEIVTSSVIDKLYNLAYENLELGVSSLLDASSSLSGKLESPAAYEDAVIYLTSTFPNLYITIPNNNYYVRFKDPVVELICLASYSTDGIGVTKQEASLVNSLLNKFANNLDITSLEDLANFTNSTINITNVFLSESSYITQYFANNTAWLNRSWSSPYIILSSIHIKMPRGCSLSFREWAIGSGEDRTKIPITIDWNSSTIQNTHSSGNGGVFRNCYLIWDDSLIPQQTSLPRLFRNCVLDKVIYREGIVSVEDQFLGCPISYIEYPTTITDVGRLFTNFRQDSRNLGIVSNTGCIVIKAVTPPTLSPNSGVYVDTIRCVLPLYIYVPDNSVAAYKSATGWSDSNIVDKIMPMSQMTQAEREIGTVTQEDIDRV